MQRERESVSETDGAGRALRAAAQHRKVPQSSTARRRRPWLPTPAGPHVVGEGGRRTRGPPAKALDELLDLPDLDVLLGLPGGLLVHGALDGRARGSCSARVRRLTRGYAFTGREGRISRNGMWERRRQRRLPGYTLPRGVVVGGGPPHMQRRHRQRQRPSATSRPYQAVQSAGGCPSIFSRRVCRSAAPPIVPEADRARARRRSAQDVAKEKTSPTKRRGMDVVLPSFPQVCASVEGPRPSHAIPHSTRRTMGHFPGGMSTSSITRGVSSSPAMANA